MKLVRICMRVLMHASGCSNYYYKDTMALKINGKMQFTFDVIAFFRIYATNLLDTHAISCIIERSVIQETAAVV